VAGTSGKQLFEERHIVGLGATVADSAAHLAGGDIECRDQRLRAVPDVFELAPFDMPGFMGKLTARSNA
jgi:hypothetical protein